MTSKILMSVDMDEWYQCRWATGSKYAIWPDTKTFFNEYYGSDRPIGEIVPLTDKILDLFSTYNITATFFFTGEIASYYPDLVRKVSECGHEIASHNHVHKDYTSENPDEFYSNLKKSKRILEKLSGQEIIGYRAPNSTISNYMIENLLDLGFKYDSSVTPTKPFMGKFGNFTNAPLNPYELSCHDFSSPGDSGLWEFPWPIFPVSKLPSGSGIMTRIAGYYYTVVSLDNALRTGDTVYYFHPYEIGPPPKLNIFNPKIKLFIRNIGINFINMLTMILQKYEGRFISGKELLESKCSKV